MSVHRCFSRHDLIGLECSNTIFYTLEGNIKSLLGQTLNTFFARVCE